MRKRLVLTLTALAFGVFSSFVVHAQVADKLLVNALSWILQKQIEELEKANDPNRPLSQYDARDRFDSRDTFAPRAQPVYQDISENRSYIKPPEASPPVVESTAVPAEQ